MKKPNQTFKTATIALTLLVGSFSCTRDIEEKSISQEGVTRSSQETGSDASFFYIAQGEKAYFKIRKDRVIIKTNSDVEAKELCKQDVFLPESPAHDVAYI